MNGSAGCVPFRDRLDELLRKQGPDATQAWLAERSGIDRSLISRLLKGDRLPTPDVLQCLAPALGIDVATLVGGTNAEDRLRDVTDHVRKGDYMEAVSTVIAYESRNRDLKTQVDALKEERDREVARRRQAVQAARDAEAQRDASERNRTELAERNGRLSEELDRYRRALANAVAEIGALRAQFHELEQELGDTARSTKVAAIMAGVAAVTGVATVAHLLGDDKPAPPRKRARKTSKRKRRAT